MHKQDNNMKSQLKKDLDETIKVESELAPNKEVDITLIIGQNYKDLDFYKEIKK